MKTLCERCPNRNIAVLLESLGEEKAAAKIVDTGCSAWWSIEYKNDETGQIETRSQCAWEHLPQYFNRVEALVKQNCGVVEEMRNCLVRLIQIAELTQVPHVHLQLPDSTPNITGDNDGP